MPLNPVMKRVKTLSWRSVEGYGTERKRADCVCVRETMDLVQYVCVDCRI